MASRQALVLPAVALLAGLPAGALAQRVDVEPSVSGTVTATHRTGAGPGMDAGSEVVTQVSPGVSVSARGGSLQASLSYAANLLLYANESDNNRVTHSLASTARYTLLGGRAGIDASASASEQVVSAFGVQGGGSTAGRDNRAQTFSYSLSPYLTGQLLGQTAYQVRLNYGASRAGSGAVGDSESLGASAGLSGRLGRIGWGLNASRQVADSGQQARTRTGRVFASLGYSPDVELQLSARLGRDTDDVRTGRSQSTTTWGLGAAWVPGPRTSISADYDRRYFGDSHSVSVSHRMRSTIWTFSDSRNVLTTPAANRQEVSAYDLFFSQFASIEPDPVKRDQLVRTFLLSRGIDPTGRVVIGGFLTSLASVQRSQQLSVAYQGLGNTALVSFSSGTSRSIVEGATGTDDLAKSDAVRQRGFSVTLSRRLSSRASVAVSGSTQRTLGTGTQAGNEVRSVAASWSTTISSKASASVGLRHTRFDSDTSPYTESAVFGTLGLRF